MDRTFVGLDVHARSVVACALDHVTGEVSRAGLVPDNSTVLAWLQALPGPVAVVYEAGPTGFGLARFLTGQGIRCLVAAPSKMHRPSGDRVKTDARDALLLARLLRLGEITEVRVPSLAQEAARALVRVREDVRADLMRARHRTSKLLLRQGIVRSGGSAWTGAHHLWLGRQHFYLPGWQTAQPVARSSTLPSPTPARRANAALLCGSLATRSPLGPGLKPPDPRAAGLGHGRPTRGGGWSARAHMTLDLYWAPCVIPRTWRRPQPPADRSARGGA
jgi:transposase